MSNLIMKQDDLPPDRHSDDALVRKIRNELRIQKALYQAPRAWFRHDGLTTRGISV